MPPAPAVVVAGLGVTGAATVLELARRGVPVLGLDRWPTPHDRGSSHGRSRIIREAYFEHPLYVPLVQHALDRWQALQSDAGTVLLRRTGALMMGRPGGALVRGALHSASLHALPHHVLGEGPLRERFPALRPEPGMVGVLELRAGMLFPERCVEALLRLAAAAGAQLHFGEALLDWQNDGDAVQVRTSAARYACDTLVLSAGPWLGALLRAHAGNSAASLPPLTIERQVVAFFQPLNPQTTQPEQLPVTLIEPAAGGLFYLLPDAGDGVKAAVHHDGLMVADADAVQRTAGDDEIGSIRSRLVQFAPDAAGELRDTSVCLYTNTPDQHFLIDRHPADPRVILASACSGHGFKFAPALAESIADLATGLTPRFDLTPFLASRFAGNATRSGQE